MSFLDLLQNLGDRLGLLESAAQPAGQPAAKIQTRTVTLAELATEIRLEEVRALANLPAELGIPFDKIYETAGIRPPANGWTVDRLKQYLLTDAFKNKDRSIVQTAILNILKSEKASTEDVVRDAMARDKALDSFESFVQKKMDDRMAARERKRAEIESRIGALQVELAKITEDTKVDQEKWREWRRRKRVQERDMAEAVGYLIDRKVITTDDEV
jgi:DNA-binding transcriptional ArsR family regulator